MSRTHIDHRDLVRFAEDKVNLPKDTADEYRAQARRLREKLEGYLSEHPDFSLPGGHPNSPTHGHLKFLHPDRASMRR